MKKDYSDTDDKTIPKFIHYCWFGKKPLSDDAKKCIESWKKYFPGYEIVQWNEGNFDICFNQYALEAYRRKKFAFFSDVARLFIVERYGGIYFDIDVEVISSFDDILKKGAFFGIENDGKLATGLGFGAEKGNWLVKEMLDYYNDKHFFADGKEDLTPCPIINSRVAMKNGFSLKNTIETVRGVTVYPKDYFNPKAGYNKQVIVTDNTHSIHHYDGSWLPEQEVNRARLRNKLSCLFGDRIGCIIYRTLFLPYIVFSHIKQRVGG